MCWDEDQVMHYLVEMANEFPSLYFFFIQLSSCCPFKIYGRCIEYNWEKGARKGRQKINNSRLDPHSVHLKPYTIQ